MISEELLSLIQVLPPAVAKALTARPDLDTLQEVILDLGYCPEIRLAATTVRLDHLPKVGLKEIEAVTQNLSPFTSDNRAGLEGTLHRISAIRNRQGVVIGLTCRVGRAIVGTIDGIKDLIESTANILFVGPPGIGKTTKLREAARLLSDTLSKRCIVVDTSNEIGGDGDIPHPAIGSARRMQVPAPDRQHAIMIEAVENHMPEVIIVDEIGTEAEALAARTIAERGVQLIATAHGHTLENLLKNPTLTDLVGGIQSVILGDEEAKFRGTQKTVLERKSLPTFDVLIELRTRTTIAIFKDVAAAVDRYLRHEQVSPQLRTQTDSGFVDTLPEEPILPASAPIETGTDFLPSPTHTWLKIFPFGLPKNRLMACANSVEAPIMLAQTIGEADMVLTVKTDVKRPAKLSALMKGRNIPLHILKDSSENQITKFLKTHLGLSDTDHDIETEALTEVANACKLVLSQKRIVDLAPRGIFLRRRQHQAVEKQGLTSLSIGEEPNRRVRIYPKLS
ncbi:MAG: R3H domain-containing nucleic acid-binding protein [Candidatus Margulisiibacteriota bacterium]